MAVHPEKSASARCTLSESAQGKAIRAIAKNQFNPFKKVNFRVF
jgi:hypothetical protein